MEYVTPIALGVLIVDEVVISKEVRSTFFVIYGKHITMAS